MIKSCYNATNEPWYLFKTLFIQIVINSPPPKTLLLRLYYNKTMVNFRMAQNHCRFTLWCYICLNTSYHLTWIPENIKLTHDLRRFFSKTHMIDSKCVTNRQFELLQCHESQRELVITCATAPPAGATTQLQLSLCGVLHVFLSARFQRCARIRREMDFFPRSSFNTCIIRIQHRFITFSRLAE